MVQAWIWFGCKCNEQQKIMREKGHCHWYLITRASNKVIISGWLINPLEMCQSSNTGYAQRECRNLCNTSPSCWVFALYIAWSGKIKNTLSHPFWEERVFISGSSICKG